MTETSSYTIAIIIGMFYSVMYEELRVVAHTYICTHCLLLEVLKRCHLMTMLCACTVVWEAGLCYQGVCLTTLF